MKKGVTIIIPTYNGGKVFSRVLGMIEAQEYQGPVQLRVIDSGSWDGTAKRAERFGAQVKRVRKEAFHHSRTRNEAVSSAEFEQVIFMVQDAVPVSTGWLSGLVNALTESNADAVYIDQIPHEDASVYARLETESTSRARGDKPILQHLDSLESFQKMPYHEAYRRINLDNVCAIYRKELLLRIPFPEVDFAEDMAWALQVLLEGHKVLYQPDIKVRHSHNRSPSYGFHRQIINSVWCARIMNRIETDLSFLTVNDLMDLTDQLDRFSMLLGEHVQDGKKPVHGEQKFNESIRDMITTSSVVNRVFRLLYDGIPRAVRRPSGEMKGIVTDEKEKIQHALETIVDRYDPKTPQQIFAALKQLTANALGRVFGETYASYSLKGAIPFRLRVLMAPFMHGV